MAEVRTDERTRGGALRALIPRGKRLRRVRLTRRRAIAAGAAGTALVCGAGLLMGMHSPMSIGSVEVLGSPELAPAVLSALGAQDGQTFASVDAEAARERIVAIDGVADAGLHWTWWNTLSVTLLEQTPVGVTAGPEEGTFTEIDSSGGRIRTVGARPAGLPLVESHSGPAAQAAALKVAAQLPTGALGGVDAVVATGARAVELRLASGTTLLLGAPEDVPEKLLLAQQLSQSQATVINVAVPERPALSGFPKKS